MTRGGALVLAVAVAMATLAGWWLFWFLTDDAFIAFRYASNSLQGWGLTWNPPPFEPVEGYTSFLWVVLLREVWRLTGLAPPQTANVLALLFGYATLFVGAQLFWRMRLPEAVERWKGLLLALALVGTVTNRTFLAWLSSGLETSLFNFLLTWWVYEASTSERERGSWWTSKLSAAGALAALTRPDGLLMAAGSVVLAAWAWARRRGSPLSFLVQTLPLWLVPSHLLWRYGTYGEWVPNTYFVKNPGWWPESGWRYLASFLVENGGWLWLGLALAWLGRQVWRRGRSGAWPDLDTWVRLGLPVGIVAFHAAYYTVVIGGDHFEYRVFSHLILLSFLTAPWLASRLGGRPRWVVVACLALVLVSWPVPWTHWVQSQELTTRTQTWKMTVPVAPGWPAPLRPLVEPWDRWQAWLIEHHVGMRHQEHKVLYRWQARRWPERADGARLDWEPLRPVMILRMVGVPGWVFPEVAILDALGLNDPVVARQPPLARSSDERKMAHDRWPPAGYFECFEPNVHIADDGGISVIPRERPLTDERIRVCHEAFR